MLRPRICQFSRWRRLTAHKIRKCFSSHRSLLCKKDYRVDPRNFIQEIHVKCCAYVDCHDHFLIICSAKADILPFHFGKCIFLIFQLAVSALSRLPCDHINTGVRSRVFQICLCHRLTKRILIRLAHQVDHIRHV